MAPAAGSKVLRLQFCHSIKPSSPLSARPGSFRGLALQSCPKRSRRPAQCNAVSSPVIIPTSTEQLEVDPLLPKKDLDSRVIAVAVDGTPANLEGLRWLGSNVFRQGDSILLISVVNNDRVSHIPVGINEVSGRVTTDSLDEDYGENASTSYAGRLAAKQMDMLQERFQPVVEEAGFSAQVRVNTISGHRSAATIAESLVETACDAKADMLVVTSHGGGLKCSYGSVARYCVQHFNRAILLLPPELPVATDASEEPSFALGINHVRELQDATCWGCHHLFRNGDKVHVLHAEEASVAKRDSTDQLAILSGLREQLARHQIKDLTYSSVRPAGAHGATPEEANKKGAAEIVRKVVEKRSRALVMVNYAQQGLMQEMMFGTLAMLVSRDAPLPLALVPQGYAVE